MKKVSTWMKTVERKGERKVSRRKDRSHKYRDEKSWNLERQVIVLKI